MGTTQTRQRRIAEQIRKDLSELIRLRVKDPRVGMVTVTWVEVAADYGHAKVYVSSLLGEDSLRQTLEGLALAAGFLRRELGRGLKLRVTPQLHFLADASIDRGVRMGALIGQARASDQALADASAHADAGADDSAQAEAGGDPAGAALAHPAAVAPPEPAGGERS
ncbi:MAG: 30S ribosome-binding factor RbfA [Pseudomonadota bacterium]|nr:30S ribosome-binding factor RbfA [Pseudomonadota bacterium]